MMYIIMYTDDMPHRYSIADARSNLPHIVDQAEAGVAVELTRRGQPVAVVVSRRTFDRLRETHGQFNEAYQRFLERFSLNEIGFDPAELLATRNKTSGRRVML